MRTVHVQELSAEKFGLYGTFADMLHAAGPHIGTNPIEFYRNMTHGLFSGRFRWTFYHEGLPPAACDRYL